MSALNDGVLSGTGGGAFLIFISSGLRRIGYCALLPVTSQPRAA
jgi:hypothetical protein